MSRALLGCGLGSAALAPVLLAGCFRTIVSPITSTPCSAVSCSGHGECVEDGEQAACVCDSGYAQPADNRTACVPEACLPDCDGKQCGADGCQGSCGECPEGNSFCNASGQCECTPDISCAAALARVTVECGDVDDGCGGSIDCTGVCPTPQTCIAATSTCSGVPPTITTQPQSVVVKRATRATFSVEVASATPVTYVWLKDGTPISAATASSYTTADATAADDGSSYTVVATNAAGSVTSDVAELRVIGGRLFVASADGVLVWNNPSTLTAPRAPDITMGVMSPIAVTQSEERLYVYADDGILVFDEALSPRLSNATPPSVTVAKTTLPAGFADGVNRLAAFPSGNAGAATLWAWGFASGAYLFPLPLSTSSTALAHFTHPCSQTPSLLYVPGDGTATDRLFMGQISGLGLQTWEHPIGTTGEPAPSFASEETAVWALSATDVRLIGAGKFGLANTAGIGVWNDIAGFSSARPPDVMLASATSPAPIDSQDFMPDLWAGPAANDKVTLAVAVQARYMGSPDRLLVWTDANAAGAATPPDYEALLPGQPKRVLGARGTSRLFVLSANSVVVLDWPVSGTTLREVATLAGSGLLDLAVMD